MLLPDAIRNSIGLTRTGSLEIGQALQVCAHLPGEFSTLLRELDSFALSSGQLDTEKLLQLPHLPAVEALLRGIATRNPGDPPGLRDSTEVLQTIQ